MIANQNEVLPSGAADADENQPGESADFFQQATPDELAAWYLTKHEGQKHGAMCHADFVSPSRMRQLFGQWLPDASPKTAGKVAKYLSGISG